MMLSRNFALSEFIKSTKAKSLGIDNTPPESVMARLAFTASKMEEVRDLLGRNPITISSGYRSPRLNQAVGGAKSSQHSTGEACDFTCSDFGTPEEVVQAIVDSDIEYDQVIYENKGGAEWVHISFNNKPRLQALVIDDDGTRAFA